MSNIPTDVLKKIECALVDGSRLHGFSSGGGLRVLRLEKYGKLTGYGEHPNVEDAFVILSDDYDSGCRDYGDVYGKLRTHYLTGSQTCTSELDAWIRFGKKIDAWHDGEMFLVKLEGMEETQAPEGFHERAMNGEVLQWDNRGYTYEIGPSIFPNGEPSTFIKVKKDPEGNKKQSDAWIYDIRKDGKGSTLNEAIDSAFMAESVEEER